MRNLPIDSLRSFLAVYDSGSVTTAADQIGRSQPAVSLQIKKLEEILETSLFRRVKKRLIPSLEGEKLCARARQIIAINDEIVGEYRKPELQGNVCLGIPSEFAITLIPAILGRFNAAYPHVALEIVSDLSRNLIQMQQQNKYDLILTLHHQSSKVKKNVISSDRLVWVGSQSHQVDKSREIPLILAKEGCIYREKVFFHLNKIMRPWRIVHTNPDLSGIKSAIEAGLGITALAKSTVPGSLKILEENEHLPPLGYVDICLLGRAGRRTEAVLKLEDFISSSLRDFKS